MDRLSWNWDINEAITALAKLGGEEIPVALHNEAQDARNRLDNENWNRRSAERKKLHLYWSYLDQLDGFLLQGATPTVAAYTVFEAFRPVIARLIETETYVPEYMSAYNAALKESRTKQF